MKAELDAIWNERGVAQINNLCIWERPLNELMSLPGEERTPDVGKSAKKFMRRVRKHWGPAPMAYCGDAKMIMPKWLRDNYKRNCPNNYKELVSLYGKLDKIDLELAKNSLTEIAASN